MMTPPRFASLLLLALSFTGTAGASAAAGKAFAPRSTVLEKQLALRGGAGPIDPTVAAKIFTGVYLLQGSLDVLSPQKIAEIYGLTSSSLSPKAAGKSKAAGTSRPTSDLTPSETCIFEWIGVYILNIGILGYCLLGQSTSVNTAIGSASVNTALMCFKQLANGTCNSCGAVVFGLGLSGIVAYATLTGQDWATSAAKLSTIIVLASGILGYVAPSKMHAVYGAEVADTDIEKFLARGQSAWMLIYGTFVWKILNDSSAVNAMGVASLVKLGYFIANTFVTKEADTVGLKMGAQYFWMLVFAVLCGSILLE